MAKRVRPEELSERELNRLLADKKRAARKKRLDAFRRSGRILEVSPWLDETATSALAEEFIIDETREAPATQAEMKQERRKRRFDRLLLVIEIAAIAGLVFLVFNGVSVVQELNQQVAAALVQPTLTPTPLIRAVVLPSGHTPPTSEGNARFNVSEIPEHLRPLHESFASAPPPVRRDEQAHYLSIPAINVINAPIVMGDGWEQLKKGVGQYLGSPDPGQNGNLILSAHNDIFGQIFRDLDQLEVGDEIIVYTNIRSYTYVIDRKPDIVEPTFVQVMDQTPDPTVTLISCYPYLVDNKRIVIKGSLAGD
ncbi:MAG: sortase [Anaerolineales bacterium]|nr:sortase [Anaerolineales bacterium]